jgi:hypothetical protein
MNTYTDNEIISSPYTHPNTDPQPIRLSHTNPYSHTFIHPYRPYLPSLSHRPLHPLLLLFSVSVPSACLVPLLPCPLPACLYPVPVPWCPASGMRPACLRSVCLTLPVRPCLLLLLTRASGPLPSSSLRLFSASLPASPASCSRSYAYRLPPGLLGSVPLGVAVCPP